MNFDEFSKIFYERAYGDSWDESSLSFEDFYYCCLVFNDMTATELALYDEYLWYENNGCVIDDALRFALGKRYNNDGKFGYPLIGYEDRNNNLIKLGKACCVNELTDKGLYNDEFWEE